MWDTLGNYSQHITNHSNKRGMAEVCELRERENSIHYIRQPKSLPGGTEWMGSAWKGGAQEAGILCACMCVCWCVRARVRTECPDTGGRSGLAVLEGFYVRERKDWYVCGLPSALSSL